MEIIKGKIAKAQKVVIYGVEGIGKSTLASKFPDPVFIDIEGSTGNMDVSRFKKPTSFMMLMNQIAYLKANPTLCKTLVIDTMDWAERMAIEQICSSANKTDITQFGYGDGFIKLEQEIGRFLNSLSDLVECGVNVVLTAHAIIKKFEQPDEMGAYDRYEMKLGNKTTAKTAALVKEWADMVLFCNYKTQVFATDDKGKKHKAQGGMRTIYAEHHPAWDAKNRHGLPFEMPMDFGQIAHIFQKPTQQQNQDDLPTATKMEQNLKREEAPPAQPAAQVLPNQGLPRDVADLMQLAGIQEEQLRDYWARAGHLPRDIDIVNVPANYWEMMVANWALVDTDIKLHQ